MTSAELSEALSAADRGTVISCHVQPNASKTSVVGMYGPDLKVALKSPPVDGKANKELCRFFADTFDLPKSSVELLSGQTSRKKRIFVPVDQSRIISEFAS